MKISWMPEQAASWAGRVDFINDFITAVAIICTVLICGTMLYFAVKYRRKGPKDKTAYITHAALLETVWTVVPTIVCLYVFWYGYDLGWEMRTPPANPLEINVYAKQWAWSYEYPNGKQVGVDATVPVGKPVRFIMKSLDVNHSFFIPAMRVKEDVIGNNYTYLWFTPTKIGTYPIFCAEYCGTNHSGMLGKLNVVPQDVYDDFVSDRGPKVVDPLVLGKQLFTNKGCIGCHSLDGTKVVGPTFKGLFGKEEHLQDGSTVTVDENYIRESITNPAAKIVKDFPPAMQPFTVAPQAPSTPTSLTEQEMNAMIAFLKTVK